MLDTDITFATDVGELWQLFRLFTAKQVGIVAALCFSGSLMTGNMRGIVW